jgi:hypothetical protein
MDSRAVLDVLHDHSMLRFVNPVQDAPLGTEPGAVYPGQGVAQRFANPVGRFQERSSDELDSS